jgi:hypothetical protein
MASHMAFRGGEPSDVEVAKIVETKTMLVSVVIFGDTPGFARESYIVFDQAGRTIKPVTVRFDGQANRSAAWPERPRFKAKVVAWFDYNDFDPKAKTTITVFPASAAQKVHSRLCRHSIAGHHNLCCCPICPSLGDR